VFGGIIGKGRAEGRREQHVAASTAPSGVTGEWMGMGTATGRGDYIGNGMGIERGR